MAKRRFSKVALGLTLTVFAGGALFAGTALAWSPEPATYGVGQS